MARPFHQSRTLRKVGNPIEAGYRMKPFRWRYRRCDRDLEKIAAERGLDVDHPAFARWVLHGEAQLT